MMPVNFSTNSKNKISIESIEEPKEKLKKQKKDGGINNLTFQYYDTLIQLAGLRRKKKEIERMDNEAFKNDLPKKKRKIVVLNHRSLVSSTSTSLSSGTPIKNTISKLEPAFHYSEPQLNQLPVNIFKEKEHSINTNETHLMTPGKLPSVRIVSSKKQRNADESTPGKDLLKLKDVNTLRKPLNMRDLLNRKTSFDVSPNSKKDLISALKPVSKSLK
ncbi:hypothetical protein QEN19_001089 [Hanseniaspora menglaensis]